MSNPIGDVADYFSRQKKNEPQQPQQQPSRPNPISTQPTENGAQQHTLNDNPLSPESPESRRPPLSVRQSNAFKRLQDNSGSHTPSSAQSFDPRHQWQRVLDRITAADNSPASTPSTVYPDVPRTHSHRNSRLYRRRDRRDEDSDSASNGEEAYEMSHRKENQQRRRQQQHPPQHQLQRQRHYSYDTNPDHMDELPTPLDLETEAGTSHSSAPEEDNYFARPFKPTEGDVQQAEQSDRAKREEQDERMRQENGQARHHWGKTLDKIRLIANLHSLPQHSSHVSASATNSLAPFYPPAFEPMFIALSTDEYGRRLPPILLPCLSVDVTDSEVLSTYGINQMVFRVELQYGDIKWVIRKTMADFVGLHYTLLVKSQLSTYVPAPPNFPNQLRNLIVSAKTTIGIDTDEELKPDEEKEEALNRRKALSKYLTQLLQRAHMLVSYDICEFLEISAISIVQDMGWKGKEGYLENRVNFVTPRLCHMLRRQGWTKEWVILRDSYLAFCEDIASTSPTDVFLFDKSVTITNKTPGIFGRYHNHITLENQFRRITIKGSKRQVDEWMSSVKKVQHESPWVKNHRFGSFAPIRTNAKVKWFIDGEDHFNAVAEAILAAKSEIYIMDWWLSPELYLRRPPEKNEDFRIDRLLQRKAREGVMIYIIVYKEMSVALPIDSEHTKRWLQGMHPNIIVQRHPDHRSIDNTVLFWSHHEKIVVVDNRLAFIGGLDLCYGRWDTHAHRLADYPAVGHKYTMVPGQDYNNPRVRDFANVSQFNNTLVDRQVTPRMPWHDVTIGVVGPIARDVSRHFIQRWNFLKAGKGMHRHSVPFLMPKGEYVAARDESHFKGSCRVQLLRSSAEWSSGIEREHSIYNAYMECISKAKHYVYIENQFFISTTTYDKILRNRIAQAMVERIKLAHKRGEKFKIYILIPLIPAFEGDLASSEAYSARSVMHFEYVSISRGGTSIMEKLREAGIDPFDYIGWYSLRNWDKIKPSSNVRAPPPAANPDTDWKKTDSGAHFHDDEAHGDAGLNSRATPSSSASAARTHVSDEEDDRNEYVSELIYIHDKLLLVDDRIILIGSANINDRSQLGNRDSEVAMLIEDTEMITTYMDGKEYKAAKLAHTLRMQLWKEHLGLLDFKDWPQLMTKAVSETQPNESAENDPLIQQNGDIRRPSGSPAQGSNEEDIRTFEASRPDQVLDAERRSKDNPQIDDMAMQAAAVLDPLADHLYYDLWRGTATKNSEIYSDLFQCVPDNKVHTFEQHRQFVPDPLKISHAHVADPTLSGAEIRERLSKVRGHLVDFPVDYLKDENMLNTSIRETVVPTVIFT